MAEQEGAPRPDVSDMYAVHGVFRDTLGAAPELVGGIGAGDTERTALIANYYENILSFLEAHHDGEEKLVFPLLPRAMRRGGRPGPADGRRTPRGDAAARGGQEHARSVAGGRRDHAEGGP